VERGIQGTAVLKKNSLGADLSIRQSDCTAVFQTLENVEKLCAKEMDTPIKHCDFSRVYTVIAKACFCFLSKNKGFSQMAVFLRAPDSRCLP
jgi:hypothetical protein